MDYGLSLDEEPLLEDFARCTDLGNGAQVPCRGKSECRYEVHCNNPPL